MSRQGFHSVDVLRLEVAVKPTTPHNVVANPSGALGAWGWETPGASYMRRAASADVLEHVASGAATLFRTEPMPVTALHYVAAAFTIPAGGGAAVTWRLEWLNSTYAVVGSTAASASLSAAGNYSLPPAQAPAGTSFFRLRFDQAAAGTARITSVRAATAATAGALAVVLRNEVTNPSFETNLTGWTAGTATTMVRTTAVAHVGTGALHVYRSVPNPGMVTATTVASVTGGLDYVLQGRFRTQVSGGTSRLGISWLDSGGNIVGPAHAQTGPTTSTTAFGLVVLAATAPSNATQALITVGHTVPGPGNASGAYVDAVAFTAGAAAPDYFDGATPASGTLAYAWTGTAHNSASTRSDTTLTGLAETEWRNILGPAHSIKTARESLNVGTLEAELLDANLDPATSATLRPGGAVRVLALVAGAWEPTFTGEIDRLLVAYDDKRVPARPPRVSLTAVDRTRRLSGARRTQGVAAVADLPFVLEGAGVPWNVNGSTAQLLANPAAVSVNENATALDQIALTRDSTASHAWVDRKGVLVATDAAPGASVRTLDEPRYSDLEVAFSSEECMNAVVIDSLIVVDAATPTGGVYGRSETVTYGPYEDAASIAQWGRRERRFTVHGLNPTQIAALGSTILARNANPGVTVQSVTLPMRTEADLADALRDLGEIVTVSNTARSLAPTLRITGVEHTIQSEPAKWLVTLRFNTSGAVAAPTVAPEVQTTGYEDTPWTPLPLLNGWRNYNVFGGGWEPASYRRLGGEVILRGLIEGSLRGSNHFATLPNGFRHKGGTQIWAVGSDTSTSRVDTTDTGTFTLAGGGVAFVSLAQIRYPVEQ